MIQMGQKKINLIFYKNQLVLWELFIMKQIKFLIYGKDILNKKIINQVFIQLKVLELLIVIQMKKMTKVKKEKLSIIYLRKVIGI